MEEQVKKTVAPKRKPTKYLREAKGSVMDSWKQMRKDGFRKEMYDQYIKDAEDFGADGYGEMVYVKRPHHVAYVRKEVAERPMDKGFEYPNMHTDQNKLGKMYDEERGGWVEMDDKARSMFEEIGGKISDFDVVGTTQDVVGKTGFNIPTGVASIAVVFMAYMTGKKYGN